MVIMNQRDSSVYLYPICRIIGHGGGGVTSLEFDPAVQTHFHNSFIKCSEPVPNFQSYVLLVHKKKGKKCNLQRILALFFKEKISNEFALFFHFYNQCVSSVFSLQLKGAWTSPKQQIFSPKIGNYLILFSVKLKIYI